MMLCEREIHFYVTKTQIKINKLKSTIYGSTRGRKKAKQSKEILRDKYDRRCTYLSADNYKILVKKIKNK